MYVTNGIRLSATGSDTSNTLWSAWLAGDWKTDGARPAPSMGAGPLWAATADAGVVSSEENGPKLRAT